MRLTPIMNSSRKRSIINDEQRRANKLIRTQGGSINIPHDEKEFEVGAILNFGQSVLNPDALEFFCEWKLIDEVKHESSWVSIENLFCYDMAVQFINETLPKATEEIAPLLKKALCYFQLQLSSTYVINDMVINVINQNINTKTNTMYGDFLKSEKNKKCIKRNMRKAKNVLKAENEVELLKAEVQKAVAENLQLNQNKNEISVEIQTLRAEKIKMLSDAQAYEIERGRLITDNERLFADVRQLGTKKKVISDKLADTTREKEKLAEFKPKIINMI